MPYRNLEDLSNTDKNFILDDYIKEIHDLVLDITKDQTLALTYAQNTPDFVSLALTGQKELQSNLRKKGLNLEALADKAEEFNDINNVKFKKEIKGPTKEEIAFEKKIAEEAKKGVARPKISINYIEEQKRKEQEGQINIKDTKTNIR